MRLPFARQTYAVVATDAGADLIDETQGLIAHFEQDDQTGEDVDIRKVHLTGEGDLYLIHEGSSGGSRQNGVAAYYRVHQDESDAIWAEKRDFAYDSLVLLVPNPA